MNHKLCYLSIYRLTLLSFYLHLPTGLWFWENESGFIYLCILPGYNLNLSYSWCSTNTSVIKLISLLIQLIKEATNMYGEHIYTEFRYIIFIVHTLYIYTYKIYTQNIFLHNTYIMYIYHSYIYTYEYILSVWEQNMYGDHLVYDRHCARH